MADAWGIDDGWHDVGGTWHEVAPETRARLRESIGDPSGARPVWVVRHGWTEPLLGPCELVLEDGDAVGVVEELPGDLPIGRHRLLPTDGGPTTHLLVTPGRCHLPAGLRAMALAVQLYAARSRRSWGIGDLTDLGRLGEWAAAVGLDYLAVSPLHAPLLADDPPASPYYPSSRLFVNPLHLDVEAVPGADRVPEVAASAAEARRLLDERIIDRARVWAAKSRALEALWAEVADHEGVARFRREQGETLEGFATFCAIWERERRPWWEWPADLAHPDGPGVAAFAADRADRVAFHAWLQLLARDQLDAAAGPTPLITDLAVGVDPGGADAWLYQDLLALDARIGAPPDEFAPDGQDWGLPPFIPHRLRDVGYEPLARALRANMFAGGGLRIDHVMGLFRLFWVPAGASPAEGGYVRYPADELLAVVAIESHRQRCLVVGEDLGTVEEGVRERLGQARILGMRLLWFEDRPPEKWSRDVLAAATSHDLATIAGAWTGADRRNRAAAGLPDDAGDALRLRLEQLAPADAEAAEVVARVHEALAASPAALAVAGLDDVLVVEDRPNMPGTTDVYPNWSLALPAPIDELTTGPVPVTLPTARD